MMKIIGVVLALILATIIFAMIESYLDKKWNVYNRNILPLKQIIFNIILMLNGIIIFELGKLFWG